MTLDVAAPEATPDATQRRAGRHRAHRGPGRSLLRNTLLAVVALLLLGRGFVAEPLRVSSASMSPNLRPGQQVLIAKLGHRAHNPHRRDIVVFNSPDTGELLIKRVAAIGGDTVGIEDGVLVVNRHPVHEGWLDFNLVDGDYWGPVVVPRGEVFVLGDNRPESIDSRRFGAIPLSSIQGRVLWRIWLPG